MSKNEFPGIENELADFGVVGPGPRRTLNFMNNRRSASGGGWALVAFHDLGNKLFGWVARRSSRPPRWFDGRRKRILQRASKPLVACRRFSAWRAPLAPTRVSSLSAG